MKAIVTLPAYNEARNLPRLLDRIETALDGAGLAYHVIVVDDGSTDGTGDILTKRAERREFTVVRHPVNRGLGAALSSGLGAAARVSGPDDVVVTLDADETHPPELIPEVIRKISEGHDVVIASRFQLGAEVTGLARPRRFFSRAASVLFQWVLPTPGMRDFTCGFRAYRSEVIRRAIAVYGQDFITEAGFASMPEAILKLRRFGLRFAEVPMTLRYDLKKGASKMKVLRTAWFTLRLILRERIACPAPPEQR